MTRGCYYSAHFQAFIILKEVKRSHIHLLGEIVKLKWSKDIKVQEYVKRVSFDVNLSKEAKKNRKAGFIHPFRLDGLSGVDPLESLAGARPLDDVCVMLLQPRVETNAMGETQLIIDCEPIQITGRFVGLVKIEARLESVGDLFRVSHYNQATRNFTEGIEEVICIPQVPKIPKEEGIARSTNKDIEKSPLNSQGWYIYGASDAKGTFVVQAIEPRALTKVEPQKVIVKSTEALEYLNREMWAKTKLQKGNCRMLFFTGKFRKKKSQFFLLKFFPRFFFVVALKFFDRSLGLKVRELRGWGGGGVFQLEKSQNCSHFTFSQRSESHHRSRFHFAAPMIVLYRK